MPSPKDLRAGHRAALARAITLIESRRADHQAAARELVQALLPDTGKAVRVGITGSPGVGKSTTIDALGMYLIEQRPQGRGAGGRSVLGAHRRLDPRRQDADGAAVGFRSRLHPPLAFVGHARRRRGENPRGDAAVRGRRLRRGAGGDRRHRPVGDRGLRHDRLLPRADAARRRRRIAGHQEGPGRTRRHDRDQQGRRRQHQARQHRGRRISRRAAYPHAPLGALASAGRDLFGADRQRHRRTLAEDARSSHRDERLGRFRRAAARAAGEMDVVDAGAADDGAAARRSPPSAPG